MPTNNDHPILDYAKPQKSSRFSAVVSWMILRFGIAAILFVAACFIPQPSGIWYFGKHPQWVIAIDHAGLTLGPSSSAPLLGWVPLIVIKLLIVAVPMWMIWRFVIRKRRKVEKSSSLQSEQDNH